MDLVSLIGTIFTDYQMEVKVANDPGILAKMGREGNLPLSQYMLVLLHRNPQIKLLHVMAYGDVKKYLTWI